VAFFLLLNQDTTKGGNVKILNFLVLILANTIALSSKGAEQIAKNVVLLTKQNFHQYGLTEKDIDKLIEKNRIAIVNTDEDQNIFDLSIYEKKSFGEAKIDWQSPE